jgi:hypothetical protein
MFPIWPPNEFRQVPENSLTGYAYEVLGVPRFALSLRQ